MSNNSFLSIAKLRKQFGGLIAVNDLTLDVAEGKVTALIGPNGAGKTTVFNLIAGFLAPSSGCIRFSGHDLSGMKPHRIAAIGIARTFQSVQIFPTMTALENVMVGRHLRSRSGMLYSAVMPPFFRKEEKLIQLEALKWLEFVGITPYAGRPAGSLPLGNQRMLEIARALALEPRLLLLDEPASGLNAHETVVMGEMIQKIRGMDITVILVEHDMELVMDISDQVAVINFGCLIACGTPKEIQRNQDVISAYLGN